MRTSWRRSAALAAVAALALAGCGDDGDGGDEQAASEENGGEEAAGDEEALEDLMGEQDLEDPNEDVEDGTYRGSGLIMPVPEGWSLDAQAFAQGIVLASNEDQTQVLGAQVIDIGEAEEAGQTLDFQEQLDAFREQIDSEPTADEEVELTNADQAHRLTFEELPSPQEDQPDSSATIVLAEGEGRFGQFSYESAAEDYDPEFADLLLDEAGFDPESDPPPLPQAPVPEGEGAPEGAPAPEGEDGGDAPAGGDGNGEG